ncbi:MAG TPA: hypothetical protein ENH39_04455, partial [Gammaproteobacteria bacterium]|nr:hypothetical protein [Gammaproteobacteria bacterium]
MFTRKRLTAGLVGAGLLLFLGAPAQASYFSSTITPGLNDYQDQSREVYFDANGDGSFGVGDILTGFLRLDDKISGPNAGPLSNSVYAIFTQQIISVGGSGGDVVEFGPVTAAGNGLTLGELGVAGAGANDMIALYSTFGGFSKNLITQSPGDRVGSTAVTMADYLDVILSEGTLDILAGVYDVPSCSGGTSDCFQGDSARVGGANSGLI